MLGEAVGIVIVVGIVALHWREMDIYLHTAAVDEASLRNVYRT